MKKTYNKIMALVGAFTFAAFSAGAVSGLVTVNSSSATGGTNYNSFTALATDLNTNGISGPVTVDVTPGQAPFVEQVTFMQIAGMTASTRVTIEGNGNHLTFPNGTSTAPHTLLLNGTDYLTINNLKISGTNATYVYVCVTTNAANSNTFAACTFSCPQNSTSSSHICYSNAGTPNSASSGGNSMNNSFLNCVMSGGYYQVWHYGITSPGLVGGTRFISCRFTDWYQYAFYGYYSKDVLWKGCEFDRMARTTLTSCYLMVGYYNEGDIFEECTVHDLWFTNPTLSTTFYGMYYFGYLAVNTSARNIFRNNIFRDIKQAGTSYWFYYNYSSNNDYYNNTFSIDNANAGTHYIFQYCYGNNTWTNNNFSISGGTATRYAYYTTTTGPMTMNNNNYNVSGTNAYIAYWMTANATSLAQWKTMSSQDVTSYSLNPTFVNVATGDLHPTNPALNDLATPMGLIIDNSGAIRNQLTPDIGALEFLTPACIGTPSSNAITSPTYAVCPGESVFMGLSSLNPNAGFTYQWGASNISNVGPFTPIPGATGLYYTAPTVTANTWFQIVQTCTNPGGGFINPVGAVMIAGPSSSVVPAYENFEGIGLANRLPNCSWSASSMGGANKTYITSGSGNRVPKSGVSFATFDNSSPGTSYYYTNPIAMTSGITYSAALWYATEYFGYNNWTNLSILVGPNQSTVGLVQVASVGPAISGPYKLLDNTFTVPGPGNYYVAIRATSSAGGAQYLSWDDLSITIPCTPSSGNNPTVTLNVSNTVICSGDPMGATANGAMDYNWNTGDVGSTVSPTLTNVSNSPVVTLLSVTGTNTITGCKMVVAESITVNPLPTIFIVANNPVVCSGQQVVLTGFGASNYIWSTNQASTSIVVTPNATSNYTVNGTNSFGCSSKYVQQITVNPNPTLTIIGPLEAACKDDMLTFTANGAGSTGTYLWYSSAGSNVYQGNVINVQIPASTTFTIMGTNSNGCVGKKVVSQEISECVGISENTGLSGLSIYPNPTTGEFVVEMNNNALKTIDVTDVTGRLVLSGSSTDTSLSMNISTLAGGIYYVKIRSEKATEVVKIVKQ